jgi:hypothetical protein
MVKYAIAVAVGLAASVSAVSASSINATLYNASDTPGGVQPGTQTMTVMFKDAANNTYAYSPAFVGQLNWHDAGPLANLNDGLNSQLGSILGPNGTFSTYCIEGVQDVTFGDNETWNLGVVNLSAAPSPGSPMGTTKAAELTELWNRDFDSIGTNNELATAFQLAIWEIVGDGITVGGETSTNFATGNFQASGDSTAIGQAVTWLNQIGSGGTVANEYSLYALSDDNIQDQVFAVPNGGTPPSVPLPAALPAGLALMSGLGIARFFRRRA